MNLTQKLRDLADSIARNEKPLQTQKDWELAERLLSRTPGADQDAVKAAVKNRDAAALDAIVARLEHPAPAQPASPTREFAKEDKDAAMRAFKKRLKLARLSDESRLGGRYTSGGRASKIDAIEPPTEFPRGIWKALAADGRLKDTGKGFYALPE